MQKHCKVKKKKTNHMRVDIHLVRHFTHPTAKHHGAGSCSDRIFGWAFQQWSRPDEDTHWMQSLYRDCSQYWREDCQQCWSVRMIWVEGGGRSLMEASHENTSKTYCKSEFLCDLMHPCLPGVMVNKGVDKGGKRVCHPQSVLVP